MELFFFFLRKGWCIFFFIIIFFSPVGDSNHLPYEVILPDPCEKVLVFLFKIIGGCFNCMS